MSGTTDFKHFKSIDNSLNAVFKFNNFVAAFGFMTQVAIWAEKHNHHPTFINTYNTVEIKLTTHDAGNTVTEKDTALAEEIEKVFKTMEC